MPVRQGESWRHGPPILTSACYCASCQRKPDRQFEQLASAPSVLDPDSGTGVILYRRIGYNARRGREYLFFLG